MTKRVWIIVVKFLLHVYLIDVFAYLISWDMTVAAVTIILYIYVDCIY